MIDEQTTRAVQKCIGEIRRELGISQEQLSAAMEVTQATYSKQERRTDMKVSTLRKAIEAMGCVMRIEVRLPGLKMSVNSHSDPVGVGLLVIRSDDMDRLAAEDSEWGRSAIIQDLDGHRVMLTEPVA